MTRAAWALAAAAATAAAAFLGLLAVDVHRWHRDAARDDLNYRSSPAAERLWRIDTTLPPRLARTALGVDDDVEFREAVRLFRLSRPRDVDFSERLQGFRGSAQIALSRIAQRDGSPAHRGKAANMLGIIALSSAPLQTLDARLVSLAGGIASFQNAVHLDPSQEEPKYNLELSLRRRKEDEDTFGVPRGQRPRDEASQGGFRDAGSGY